MLTSTLSKFTLYHKYAQLACQHIVVVPVVPSASSQSEKVWSTGQYWCNKISLVIISLVISLFALLVCWWKDQDVEKERVTYVKTYNKYAYVFKKDQNGYSTRIIHMPSKTWSHPFVAHIYQPSSSLHLSTVIRSAKLSVR